MQPTRLLPALALSLTLLAACSSTDRDFTLAPADEPDSVANTPVVPSPAVSINGHAQSAADLAAFQQTYGQALPPGAYWYDSRSGAIGVLGQGIGGFLLAGHDLGAVPRDASNGNTGVVVNGRELPVAEWAFVSRLLGVQVLPGRYWIDALGNYGHEGVEQALGNLAAGAASGGGGGSNDNYWSSRYGAGNSNADNSAGYVYIPGTGSVSYGL
ncbi:MAG: hypothetical protein HZA52_09520 [Planctomycetes bacterium]|nr:hypothetical protein [Planctomycetota bacterium]